MPEYEDADSVAEMVCAALARSDRFPPGVLHQEDELPARVLIRPDADGKAIWALTVSGPFDGSTPESIAAAAAALGMTGPSLEEGQEEHMVAVAYPSPQGRGVQLCVRDENTPFPFLYVFTTVLDRYGWEDVQLTSQHDFPGFGLGHRLIEHGWMPHRTGSGVGGWTYFGKGQWTMPVSRILPETDPGPHLPTDSSPGHIARRRAVEGSGG